MFLCQLTGSVAANPVVTKDGLVYEKGALNTYLRDHDNHDPSGNKIDTEKDVIELKSSNLLNKPSSAVAVGDVSTLLESLNDRVNSILIELQETKAERDEARHQLTHMLYLRDSATQVIAKHLEEIEFLKSQLKQARARPTDTEADGRQSKIARKETQLAEKIETLATRLMLSRKQRKIIARPHEDFQKYKVRQYKLLPPSNINCFKDVACRKQDSRRVPGLIVVGHKQADVYSLPLETEEEATPSLLCSLQGHDTSVTAIESLVYPSLGDLSEISLALLNSSSSSAQPFESCLNIFTGCEDGTVRHWKEPSYASMEDISWLEDDLTTGAKIINALLPTEMKFTCQNIFRPSLGPISSLRLHPMGTLLGVTGKTNHWTLYDIVQNDVAMNYLLSGFDPAIHVTDLVFQPDGNLAIGGTTENVLPIWDMRAGVVEAKLSASAPATSMSFSEIGYHVAVCTADNKLSIWDLRKLTVISEVQLPGTGLKSCAFDHSGKHISAVNDGSQMVISALDKKRFDVVATWDCSAEPIQTMFDHRTDDYMLRLDRQGILTSVHAY